MNGRKFLLEEMLEKFLNMSPGRVYGINMSTVGTIVLGEESRETQCDALYVECPSLPYAQRLLREFIGGVKTKIARDSEYVSRILVDPKPEWFDMATYIHLPAGRENIPRFLEIIVKPEWRLHLLPDGSVHQGFGAITRPASLADWKALRTPVTGV